MTDLAGKQIVLGMTGGVAAYKTCELARRLGDEGATVQVVMTRNAQRFVTATTMQALTGRPVFDDLWDARVANAMGHIELTRTADAILIVPASAHLIARLAQGSADDLLTTLALARRRETCPLLLAPAMNVEMWSHPAMQRNAQQVVADGAILLGPAQGDQACGEIGSGRMLEPHEILQGLIAVFQPKSLRGHRVVLTAGPTFEPIDPVRGITNRSSGKMGFALARAAREAGAEVTLIAGPTALTTPFDVMRHDVTTAREMLDAAIAAAAGATIFIAVAAVADWRVDSASASKIKKDAAAGTPTLHLVPNPDIVATIAGSANPPFCVGFAAETDDLVAYAQGKLQRKRLQMIVANRAQDALGADAAELIVIDAAGSTTLASAPKLDQARRLVSLIGARVGARTGHR